MAATSNPGVALQTPSNLRQAEGRLPPRSVSRWSQTVSWVLIGLIALSVVALTEQTISVLIALAMATALLKHPVALPAVMVAFLPLQPSLVPLAPFNLQWLDEFVIVFLAVPVLLPSLLKDPRAFLVRPPVLLVIAFCLLGALSGWVNEAPMSVWVSGLEVTIDTLVLFLVAFHLRPSRRALMLLVGTVGTMSCVLLLVAVLQKIFGQALAAPWQTWLVESGQLRPPSLLRHPNEFGMWMALACFLAAAWQIASGSRWAFLAVVAAAGGAALSVSRSTYAALLAGLVAGLVLYDRRLWRPLLGVVAVFAMMSSVSVPAVEGRIAKVAREGGDARWSYAKKAVPIIQEHPLLGVGPGRFGGVIAHRTQSPVHDRYGLRFTSTWTTVDSFWVHLTVESGILGLGIFLALLAWLWWTLRRGIRRGSTPPLERMVLLWAGLVLIAQGLYNLTSMAFEANALGGPVWLLWGCAWAACMTDQEAQSLSFEPAPAQSAAVPE